jgi:hypothetical protein
MVYVTIWCFELFLNPRPPLLLLQTFIEEDFPFFYCWLTDYLQGIASNIIIKNNKIILDFPCIVLIAGYKSAHKLFVEQQQEAC